MLGHRGCRLGITYPEIYEMQVRAIFQAACDVKKDGIDVHPEVMIPLVGTTKELQITERDGPARRRRGDRRSAASSVDYLVGTMIEIPRAALIADKLAETAEFFSFGTNDLTQMTFGYSRDDAGSFLPEYVDKKILPKDPFESIDQEGVGQRPLLALMGLLIAAAIAILATQMVSQKIGISSEPLSAREGARASTLCRKEAAGRSDDHRYPSAVDDHLRASTSAIASASDAERTGRWPRRRGRRLSAKAPLEVRSLPRRAGSGRARSGGARRGGGAGPVARE